MGVKNSKLYPIPTQYIEEARIIAKGCGLSVCAVLRMLLEVGLRHRQPDAVWEVLGIDPPGVRLPYQEEKS